MTFYILCDVPFVLFDSCRDIKKVRSKFNAVYYSTQKNIKVFFSLMWGFSIVV